MDEGVEQRHQRHVLWLLPPQVIKWRGAKDGELVAGLAICPTVELLRASRELGAVYDGLRYE